MAKEKEETLSSDDLQDNVLVIRVINSWKDFRQQYKRNPNPDELYDLTRGHWVDLFNERHQADLAFAVVSNRVVGVFKVGSWHEAGTTKNKVLPWRQPVSAGRVEFVEDGKASAEEVERYLNKKLVGTWARQTYNPFKLYRKVR